MRKNLTCAGEELAEEGRGCFSPVFLSGSDSNRVDGPRFVAHLSSSPAHDGLGGREAPSPSS